MTKAMMISIHPEHAANIVEGNKTIEVRKYIPKDFTGWVYIYATKKRYAQRSRIRFRFPLGSVIARFWFDEFITISESDMQRRTIKSENGYFTYFGFDKELTNKVGLSTIELEDYLFKTSKHHLFGWKIKNLELLYPPKHISSFGFERAPQKYYYFDLNEKGGN